MATTTEPSSEVSDVPSDHTSPESGHHVNATVIEEDLSKPRPPVPPTPEEIARRKHKMEILQRVHRLQHLMKRLKQQKMLQEQMYILTVTRERFVMSPQCLVISKSFSVPGLPTRG